LKKIKKPIYFTMETPKVSKHAKRRAAKKAQQTTAGTGTEDKSRDE
jgi:hypothetical protein